MAGSLSSPGDSSAEARDRRSGITLRELEVLQRLIDTGTAMNAARALGISQSAVSRRLAQLESRLGIPLFVRTGARLVPNVDALSINEQLRPVFATLESIAGHAEAEDAGHSGTLSVVAPPTIADSFLPSLVVAFCKRHPEMRIVYEVLASDALFTGIAEARFDLGLTDSRSAHEGILTEPLISTQAVCLIPRGHPLAARDVVGPADLDGEAFISLARRHSCRSAIDRVLERAGTTPRVVIEASTNIAAAAFVAAGMGITIVNPFPISNRLVEGIVLRPFRPAIDYTAHILLPASRAPSAAARAFVTAIHASVEKPKAS
ncbi:LysR substrate-binding domain-containing protein [uncultured Jannaschia sp.]|uniref:LysR substrate-binding domain-containing protein n=1 Tax=uncultured Jannaschia sp. TaxID=293347 RepID=UPI00260B2255|nr:LysR substrate-binding domain-containing protein [uncultured Jannaschia sp.]